MQFDVKYSVVAGILLLAYAHAEPLATERVLAKPLFHSASRVISAPVVIDRRLFKQLSVAPNADVLPRVKTPKVERFVHESAMALALKQYKKEQQQKRRWRSAEEARKRKSPAYTWREQACQSPSANQNQCIAAMNQHALPAALALQGSADVLIEDYEVSAYYCDEYVYCDSY
jgi:hypothetical protein